MYHEANQSVIARQVMAFQKSWMARGEEGDREVMTINSVGHEKVECWQWLKKIRVARQMAAWLTNTFQTVLD